MVRTLVVNRLRVLGIRLDVHRVLPCGAFLCPDDTPESGSVAQFDVGLLDDLSEFRALGFDERF